MHLRRSPSMALAGLALTALGFWGCGSQQTGTIGPETGANSTPAPEGAPVGRQGATDANTNEGGSATEAR